jgi:Fibronectin type III domain
MSRRLLMTLTTLAILALAQVASAEISVSIDSVTPLDGVLGEGDSAIISWKITADSESGDWRFEIGGDGTWDSGETASSGDTSGSFSGTTQGSSTIKSTDLDDGDGDYSVYLIAVDDSDDTIYDSTSTTITLDNPPDQVTNLSAGNGNEKVFLAWDAMDIVDLDYYLVYYSRTSGTSESDYTDSEAAEGASPINVDDVASFILTGLENGSRYYVRVSAVDESGVEGVLSEEAGATPRDSQGLTEVEEEEGGCFIATAAFGSIDHPTVRVLRTFRDRVLLKSGPGTRFVDAYYQYSPPMASRLSAHPTAAYSVRLALIPTAWFASAWMRFPTATFALVVAMLMLLSLVAVRKVATARRRVK